MQTAAEASTASHSEVPLLSAVKFHWKRCVALAIITGGIFAGIAMLIPPTFTARTVFIIPAQQQNSAAAAIASLGPLSGLVGSAAGVKSIGDQYLSLMSSNLLTDRIIDKFNLSNVYGTKLRTDTRREFLAHVRMSAGKKDNLISIEVDDHEPQRAADIANAFIAELQRLNDELALNEAQHRRKFFEDQFRNTKMALTDAQLDLQRTGFDSGAIRAEPKAVAEAYSKLKAQIVAAEVKLSASSSMLSPRSVEVASQQAAISSMREQLQKMEEPARPKDSSGYLDAYRNFKYQEALFDIYARQFELAKLDEARQAGLIQVLDKAQKPERKSKPQRSLIALGGILFGVLVAVASVYFQERRRASQAVTS